MTERCTHARAQGQGRERSSGYKMSVGDELIDTQVFTTKYKPFSFQGLEIDTFHRCHLLHDSGQKRCHLYFPPLSLFRDVPQTWMVHGTLTCHCMAPPTNSLLSSKTVAPTSWSSDIPASWLSLSLLPFLACSQMLEGRATRCFSKSPSFVTFLDHPT